MALLKNRCQGFPL